jgi:hypothetical protein
MDYDLSHLAILSEAGGCQTRVNYLLHQRDSLQRSCPQGCEGQVSFSLLLSYCSPNSPQNKFRIEIPPSLHSKITLVPIPGCHLLDGSRCSLSHTLSHSLSFDAPRRTPLTQISILDDALPTPCHGLSRLCVTPLLPPRYLY